MRLIFPSLLLGCTYKSHICAGIKSGLRWGTKFIGVSLGVMHLWHALSEYCAVLRDFNLLNEMP